MTVTVTTSTPLDLQIEKTTKTLYQAKALLARLHAQKAAGLRKQQRKLEDRRKILVGAVVLKKAAHDLDFALQLNAWLDAGLTREVDRAAFSEIKISAASNGVC